MMFCDYELTLTIRLGISNQNILEKPHFVTCT